jgi:type VI secretion system secreted protein Hcp
MKIRKVTSALALLAGLAYGATSQAELNAYMRVIGAKQGEIKGSVTQKGRENSIMVIATNHLVVSPVDSATGMMSGKVQQKPFLVTKEVDRSSPELHAAHGMGEVLPTVTIQYWQPRVTGSEFQHFTITMKNARIVSIHHAMPNNKEADLMKLAAYEEISFIYESITWTWNDGGITYTDNWNAVR